MLSKMNRRRSLLPKGKIVINLNEKRDSSTFDKDSILEKAKLMLQDETGASEKLLGDMIMKIHIDHISELDVKVQV